MIIKLSFKNISRRSKIYKPHKTFKDFKAIFRGKNMIDCSVFGTCPCPKAGVSVYAEPMKARLILRVYFFVVRSCCSGKTNLFQWLKTNDNL